jgi:hypothetical protein
MIITICVHDCRVIIKGEDPGPHLVAIGYMSNGEELSRSNIRAGHSPSVRAEAVAEVVAWLKKYRPGWDIETAPPDKNVVIHERGPHDEDKKTPVHPTLRDCDRQLSIQRPGHAQAQNGEIWTCPCGRHFEHVCDEAEGCRWDLMP